MTEEKENNDLLLMKMLALENNIVTALIRITSIENILIEKQITTKAGYNEVVTEVTKKVAEAMKDFGSVLDDVKQEIKDVKLEENKEEK